MTTGWHAYEHSSEEATDRLTKLENYSSEHDVPSLGLA